MSTTIVNTRKEGLHTVGAINSETDYVRWQVSEDDPEAVYFEYGNQIMAGYNTVSECTVDMDGCHIVLKDGAVVHLYRDPPRHPDLPVFTGGLRSLYASTPTILEIHDV